MVSGSYGLPPMRPALFVAVDFPSLFSLRCVLLGKTAFFRPSGRGGLSLTSDGEKHGFMTSVVGLASQKWGNEGDWPLGIGRTSLHRDLTSRAVVVRDQTRRIGLTRHAPFNEVRNLILGLNKV